MSKLTSAAVSISLMAVVARFPNNRGPRQQEV
ncbi:hypothetical protein ABH939_006559 [Rhodococcus sp. 27YEA6]